MHPIKMIKSISTIATMGTTANEILLHFNSVRRHRKDITVGRLLQVCSPGTKRRAVTAVLRQLEAGGFGKIKRAKPAHPAHFEWRNV